MSEAIRQALPMAIAIALSPFPIIGVVLMLGTPRARQNSLGFLAGWIAGVAALGAAVLLVSSGAGASDEGEPASWPSVAELALGVFLVVLAAKQWRGRSGDGEGAATPSWMESVDHFRAPRAAGLAILLSVVNPKNLLLVVAGAAAIAQSGASTGQQAGALVIFVAIASLGPGVPIGIYFALGERSKPILDEIRGWMARNNGAVLAVVCLLIGVKLIGDGIAGL